MREFDYEMWLNQPETQEVLKELLNEINLKRSGLMNGDALWNQKSTGKIAIQYAYTVGYTDGLEFFKKAMLSKVEEDSDAKS